MPVVKRLVEPVHCSRAAIPKGVRNELEAVSVNTLSSVILQLSSLAKHAESIFSELFTEANSIHQRSVSVQQRLEQLAVKVTKLDSAGEESKFWIFLEIFCKIFYTFWKASFNFFYFVLKQYLKCSLGGLASFLISRLNKHHSLSKVDPTLIGSKVVADCL